MQIPNFPSPVMFGKRYVIHDQTSLKNVFEELQAKGDPDMDLYAIRDGNQIKALLTDEDRPDRTAITFLVDKLQPSDTTLTSLLMTIQEMSESELDRFTNTLRPLFEKK